MTEPDHYKRSSKGGFNAIVEVRHQLHCLVSTHSLYFTSCYPRMQCANTDAKNLIRQFTWLSHYRHPPEDLSFGEISTQMHVNHCIESTRQYLMCTADATPVFLELRNDTVLGTRGDFNTFHRCRNISRRTKWLDETVSVNLSAAMDE